MKAELVPLNGDPPIPITRDVTVVGRREYCDIRIDDASLSKRHCVLVRTDGLVILRDLVTTNGTKVNGQRVMWAALLPNDRLTLGSYKARLYLGSDDAPAPSEQPAGAFLARLEAGGGPPPAPVAAVAAAPVAAASRKPAKPTPLTLNDDDDDPISLDTQDRIDFGDGGMLKLSQLDQGTDDLPLIELD